MPPPPPCNLPLPHAPPTPQPPFSWVTLPLTSSYNLQAVGSHATYIVAFIDEGRVLYVTGNRTHQSAPLVVRPVPRQTPSGLAALGLGPGRARLFWVQSGGVHMALADPREGVAAALPIAALPAPPSAAAYAVGRAGAGPFALVHAAPGGGLRVQGPAEVLSAGGNATRLRAVGLGLTGPEAGLVAWVEEGEGEGCEAGCVRLLRFVGAEARAQRVLTGNATEGPVVLPGPDGFAVLWVDGASDIRHVTLSADLEIVQEQVVWRVSRGINRRPVPGREGVGMRGGAEGWGSVVDGGTQGGQQGCEQLVAHVGKGEDGRRPVGG